MPEATDALSQWRKPHVREAATDESSARRLIATSEMVLACVQIAPDGSGMPAALRRWFNLTKRSATSSIDAAFTDHRTKPNLYPAPAVELDLDEVVCWIGT